MIIIGIAGKARAGKTSIAQFLQKHIKGKMHIIAFADSLKEECAKACGVTVEYIDLNKDMFRPLLQWWGSDFKRKHISENYWIHKVASKILYNIDDGIGYIIPDVRFQNELDWVKSFDTGYSVKVTRPHGPVIQTSKHISETELDNCETDFMIDNSGDLAQLEKQSIKLIQEINELLLPKAQLK